MVATAKRAIATLTGRPVEPVTSIAARWARFYHAAAEAPTWADRERLEEERARVALETRSELLLLELLVTDPNIARHHRDAAAAVLRGDDGPVVPLSAADTAELARLALQMDEEPAVETFEAHPDPRYLDRIQRVHIVPVGRWALAILEKESTYRVKREEAAQNAAAEVERLPGYEVAYGQARAELKRIGLWGRLVLDDPGGVHDLTTPHYLARINEFRPVTGWPLGTVVANLLAEARKEGGR